MSYPPSPPDPKTVVSGLDEKGQERFDATEDTKEVVDIGVGETIDLFLPLPVNLDLPIENHRVATFRAVFVGCMLGSAVNAANLYLGLKTGLTFGANLFGALFGFLIIKALTKALPDNFPVLGGYFGVKENAIVQTAAITSGGLTFIFVSGVPTMYRLGVMSTDPRDDYWRLVTFTFICAFYGLMFSAPMRNFFLKTVARDMGLVFPSTTAGTFMLRDLHQSGVAAKGSRRKMHIMLCIFAVSFVLTVVGQYAKGIIWDWHVFTWIFIWSNYGNGALAAESWFWFYELTPAFHGIGMLVGLNVAMSYLGGAVLSWGIIGPALIASGQAVGLHPYKGTKWESYTVYASSAPSTTAPSPYYWMIWPGIMIMLSSSVMEVLMHWRQISTLSKRGIVEMYKTTKHYTSRTRHASTPSSPSQDPELPTVADEFVPWWVWLPGTILMIVLACVILALQYTMSIETSIVALLFGFILAFVAIQVQGNSDISPLSAITKSVQLVIGGMVRSSGNSLAMNQRINIAGAQIAGGAAMAATEMIADFRIGYLLGVPVIQQFVVQIIGNAVGIFVAPAMFILFAKAYPCITAVANPRQPASCEFLVPSANSWSAIANGVLSQGFPIPTSSAITALVLGVFSIFLVWFKGVVLVGPREKYRVFLPNMPMVGLAMILPATCYNMAMATGAIFAKIWTKRYPDSAKTYLLSVAAALVIGESIGGVMNAILQIAGVGGSKYGTKLGCPLGAC